MKFDTLELFNFKSFFGKQEIDLSIEEFEDDKNIILIGGLNGSGKTSLLQAIKLCLFGKRYDGNALSKKSYKDFLYSLSNRKKVKAANKMESHLKMDVVLDSKIPRMPIEAKREWEVYKGYVKGENFTLKSKGGELELVPRNYWQDYVFNFAPPEVSSFFFFDGEEIKELSRKKSFDNLLSKSLKKVLGLKMYNKLHSDLKSLEGKIKRKNLDLESIKNKLDDLENKLESKQNAIEEKQAKLEKKEEKKARLKEERRKLESELHREAGKHARQREELKHLIKRQKSEKERVGKKIEELSEKYLPFVIPSDLREELIEQLSYEKKNTEIEVKKRILKQVKNEFVEIFADKLNSDLRKEQRRKVENNVRKTFLEIQSSLNQKREDYLLSFLSDSRKDQIIRLLVKGDKKIKSELSKLVRKKQDLVREIGKKREKLNEVPDEDLIRDSVERLGEIEAKVKTLEQEISLLKDETEDLKEEIPKIKDSIDKLEDEIYCTKEDNKKIDLSQKSRKAITELQEEIMSSKIDELEEFVTEMYDQLSNKKEMVDFIKIDRKDFSPSLVNHDGEVVDYSSISTGERQIFVISLLWGMTKISGYNLPLIMDAPLSGLDEIHARNLIENFFPEAGEQVVLLSTDDNIDKKFYDQLKPKISRAYTLSLESEDKVQSGYFFD